MTRRKKWLLVLVLGPGFLLLTVLLGWHQATVYARQRVRQVVATRLERALGRPVRLEALEHGGGRFRLRNLHVAGPRGSPPLLQSPVVEVQLNLPALLFRRRMIIHRLDLHRPHFHLTADREVSTARDPLATLDQLHAYGVRVMTVTGGRVTARLGANRSASVIQLEQLDLLARLAQGSNALTGSARQLRYGGHRLTGLQLRGTRTGRVLNLEEVSADYAGAPLRASGSHALDTGKSQAQIEGRLSLERLEAPMIARWKPQGVVVARINFVAEAGNWQEASGTVEVKQVTLQLAAGRRAPELTGEAQVRVTPAETKLDAMVLRSGTSEIRGSLKLPVSPLALGDGSPYEFTGTVTVADWTRVAQLTGSPPPLRRGRLVLKLSTRGQLPELSPQLSGAFTLNEARLKLGPRPISVSSASGEFVRNGDAVTLRGVRAQLADVTATGGGTLSPTRFTVDTHLSGPRFAAFAQQFLSGDSGVQAGAYAIRAVAAGTPQSSVSTVSGTLRLAEVALPGAPTGLRLSSISGAYRQVGGRTVISDLRVSAPEFTGAGHATLSGGDFTMKGTLRVADLAGLRRLNPTLTNLRSGSGIVNFIAHGQNNAVAQARVTGTASVSEGEWGLPDGPYGLSRLEFTHARAGFVVEGARASVHDVIVIGSEFNLTGAGGLRDRALSGNGRGSVMRSLALRVIADATSMRLLREVEKVPLESLPVRLQLTGTLAAPRIHWTLDEQRLEQLVVKAALKHPKLQREVDRLKPRLQQELERVLGKKAPPASSESAPTTASEPSGRAAQKKQLLDRLLRGALEKAGK